MANEAAQAAFDFDAAPAPIEIPAAHAPIIAPAPAIEREWIYEKLPEEPEEDFGAECWPLLLKLEAIGERLSVRDRRIARSYRTALARGRRIHGEWLEGLRETLRWYQREE